MKKIILTVMLVVAVALSAPAKAKKVAPSDPQLPQDSAIVYGKLPCGLTYYIMYCGRPAGKTNFYLIENVGSAVEEKNQLGISHFIEHMAFNGSKNFPGNEMVGTLERHGIAFGYDINAFTSSDATIFKICNVKSSLGKEMVDTCLLVLKDIAMNCTFPDEAVDGERSIIIEEWRQDNGAFARMTDKMFPVLFGAGNPYTQKPIGTVECLQAFTPNDLREYYAKWYQPQHQAIVVIGNIGPREIEQMIKQQWADVRAPKHPSVRKWAQIPDNNGVVAGVITDKEFPGSQIDFWFKVDIPPRDMRDRVSYINSSYNGFMAYMALSHRLGDILYESNAPFSYANAEFSQYYLADSRDGLRMYALYDNRRRDEALARLVAEAKRYATYGVTDEEVENARESMRTITRSLPTIHDEKNNHEQFDRISEHFLKGNVVLSVDDEVATYSNFLDTVQARSVNAFIRKYMTPQNLTAFMVERDTGDPLLPTDAQLAERIQLMWDTIDVSPKEEDLSYKRPLLDKDPVPGRIISVEVDTNFIAKHYTLSNGARVVLCFRDVLADQVELRAVQRGGESAVLDSGLVDGTYACTMANLGGLGDFSVIDLSRKFNSKRVDIDLTYTPYAEIIDGESRVDELEDLLQLVYLRFMGVRDDAAAFDNWRNTRIAHLVDLADDPNYVFSDSIRSLLYGKDHPYMRRIGIEDVKTLDFEHARRIAEARLKNAAAYDFIIVGNIDFKEVEPLIEKYLGSLPGDGFAERAPFKPFPRLAREGVRSVRFAKPMESPFTRVYQAYEIHRPYTLDDEMTLYLLEALLQKEYIQTLRADAGGTYVPTVTATSGEVDGFHSLTITFDTNAEAAEPLLQSAIATLRDIAENGVDLDKFQAVHNYEVNSEYSATLQQSFPMIVLTHQALYEDLDAYNRWKALLQVTPADLQAMAQALLSASSQLTLIMDGK